MALAFGAQHLIDGQKAVRLLVSYPKLPIGTIVQIENCDNMDTGIGFNSSGALPALTYATKRGGGEEQAIICAVVETLFCFQ